MDEVENGQLPDSSDLPVNAPDQAQETEVKPVVEPEKPKNEVPKWAKDRFADLTAKRHAAEQAAAAEKTRAADLERQLAEFRQQQETGSVDYSQLIEKAAQEKAKTYAAQMAERQSFDQKCNDIAGKGKAELGSSFDEAIGNLNSYFGGLSEDFLKGLVNVPDAHKVISHLGQPENLEEFARINNLDPYARAVELVKLSSNVGKAKPVSSAPAPIDPIDGSGKVNTDPDKMTDAEWKAWRNSTKKSKR